MEWLELLLDMDTAIILFILYEYRSQRAKRKAEIEAIWALLRELEVKVK